MYGRNYNKNNDGEKENFKFQLEPSSISDHFTLFYLWKEELDKMTEHQFLRKPILTPINNEYLQTGENFVICIEKVKEEN